MTEYPIFKSEKSESRYFNLATDLYSLINATGADVKSSHDMIGNLGVKTLYCDGIQIRCCDTAKGMTEISAKIDSDKGKSIWEEITSSGKIELINKAQTQEKIKSLDDFSPTLRKHGKTIEEVKDYILKAVNSGAVPESLMTVTIRRFAIRYFPGETEFVTEIFRLQFEKKKRNDNSLGDYDPNIIVIENIITDKSIRKWLKGREKP